jgi:hypothetical protein
MIKIDLPDILVGQSAKAHPFPFQIAFQTQEFIQGAIFYISIADISSGAYMRQKDGLKELEADYFSQGEEKGTWDLGWKLLEKYKDVFKITVFQNVLVTINSHWDWYIRNLANFVIFARNYVQGPLLNKTEKSYLNRIGFLSICDQLAILEKSCGISFGIPSDELATLKEMSLVRNLALHNRWEVDQKYLDNTSNRQPWKIGELRLFDSSELRIWHQSLLQAVKKSWISIATKYINAPAYPKK